MLDPTHSFSPGTSVVITWINQLTAGGSRCLLPAKKFPLFSKPLCTWSALGVMVRPHGWVCARTDAHPHPRCSTWRVVWVGRCAPNGDIGMSLDIGLHLVLTEMSSNQKSGRRF